MTPSKETSAVVVLKEKRQQQQNILSFCSTIMERVCSSVEPQVAEETDETLKNASLAKKSTKIVYKLDEFLESMNDFVEIDIDPEIEEKIKLMLSNINKPCLPTAAGKRSQKKPFHKSKQSNGWKEENYDGNCNPNEDDHFVVDDMPDGQQHDNFLWAEADNEDIFENVQLQEFDLESLMNQFKVQKHPFGTNMNQKPPRSLNVQNNGIAYQPNNNRQNNGNAEDHGRNHHTQHHRPINSSAAAYRDVQKKPYRNYDSKNYQSDHSAEIPPQPHNYKKNGPLKPVSNNYVNQRASAPQYSNARVPYHKSYEDNCGDCFDDHQQHSNSDPSQRQAFRNKPASELDLPPMIDPLHMLFASNKPSSLNKRGNTRIPTNIDVKDDVEETGDKSQVKKPVKRRLNAFEYNSNFQPKYMRGFLKNHSEAQANRHASQNHQHQRNEHS